MTNIQQTQSEQAASVKQSDNSPWSHLAIGVVGGDLRQCITARELEREGFLIYTYALGKTESCIPIGHPAQTLEELINRCDALLLPLPVSRNGYTLHTPLSTESIPFTGLFSAIQESGKTPLIMGGRVSEAVAQTAADYDIAIIDYYEREELQIANAIPTSEGAIELAMKHFPYTLHNSNCTVLGFGRIGKVLAKTLRALGANVCVVARKETDFAWIDAMDCTPVPLGELERALCRCQLLFNTVPSMLIGSEQLQQLSRDTVLIDLASVRGIDAQSAKEHGNQLFWALSLPGKTAPGTAGCIIKNSVMRILTESFEGGGQQ